MRYKATRPVRRLEPTRAATPRRRAVGKQALLREAIDEFRMDRRHDREGARGQRPSTGSRSNAAGHRDREMTREKSSGTVREAVGVFDDAEHLQQAIDELLSSGFD